MNITKALFKMQDVEYKSFQSKLLPTIDSDKIIGVRTPVLKSYALKLQGTSEAEVFLSSLPHEYYEENNLHAFLIMSKKDFDFCLKLTDAFLPFVDNWATCDSLRPKCFGRHKTQLLKSIKAWLISEHEYTVRFAIEMMMIHFLDGDFNIEYMHAVARIKSKQYYINILPPPWLNNMTVHWKLLSQVNCQFGYTTKRFKKQLKAALYATKEKCFLKRLNDVKAAYNLEDICLKKLLYRLYR